MEGREKSGVLHPNLFGGQIIVGETDWRPVSDDCDKDVILYDPELPLEYPSSAFHPCVLRVHLSCPLSSAACPNEPPSSGRLLDSTDVRGSSVDETFGETSGGDGGSEGSASGAGALRPSVRFLLGSLIPGHRLEGIGIDLMYHPKTLGNGLRQRRSMPPGISCHRGDVLLTFC